MIGAKLLELKNEHYLKAFESFEKNGFNKHPQWLQSLQKEAFSQFLKLGFPTTRNENWKYTNVEPLLRDPYDFDLQPESNLDISETKISLGKIGSVGWDRLVFVNGFIHRGLSSPSLSAEMGSLSNAIMSGSKVLESHLGRLVKFDHGFTALNTAFMQDGAFVFVPQGKELERPIHLIFISCRDSKKICQPRNLIVLAPHAKATIIESYISINSNSYFTNAITEIVLQEGSELEHYKIQKESDRALHVGTAEVQLGQKSNYTSYSLSIGALLGRNNLTCVFNEEGANCTLQGLYLASGEQHLDNCTVMDHQKSHGKSRQFYKGILDGKSRAVFSGKIFVRLNAQKTDANQINKNLTLSDDAIVNTKPQLEILANDVKCTHGAAVGQLDDDEIFYLKTRGIEEKKARALLTYGFANEVIGQIKIPSIRQELDNILSSKFHMMSELGAPHEK